MRTDESRILVLKSIDDNLRSFFKGKSVDTFIHCYTVINFEYGFEKIINDKKKNKSVNEFLDEFINRFIFLLIIND